MRWRGHIECMGKVIHSYIVLSENLKGIDHLENLGINLTIIWRLNLKIKLEGGLDSAQEGTSGMVNKFWA